MAKIRRCKLSWTPSESDKVVSYRLYWSMSNMVDYDSGFLELGNVTEVYLPDVLKYDPHSSDSFILGITAVDKMGNESDMLTLPAPYKAEAPPPPTDPLLTKMDTFMLVEPQQKKSEQVSKPISSPDKSEVKVKYYDDVGYRKLDIDQ